MKLVEKILGKKAGEKVSVTPDYLLINDGIGHEAVKLVKKGIANKNQIIVIIDHDVPAGDSQGAAIFQELVTFSKEYEVKFIQAKGVTYSVVADEFLKVGQIVASCGAHNSIYGADGALGIHVSVEEMAKLLQEGSYDITVPKTIGVELKEQFIHGSEVMDAVITFLGEVSPDKLQGKVIEFFGKGIEVLEAHEKKILCSMATQTGAFSAFVSENNANEYEEVITFDLNKVVPAVALPKEEKEDKFSYEIIEKLKGNQADVGFIGGYTGGYIEDLRGAAKLMKEKRIALGFRLSISPVSSAVYLQALEEGLIDIFIDFGAQILPPSDRNIITQGAGVIGSGETMITTGSYNYAGCLGMKDSKVYIASVSSVVNAALTKAF